MHLPAPATHEDARDTVRSAINDLHAIFPPRQWRLRGEAVEKRICRVRRADLRSQIAAGLRADPGTQARIACSSGPTPMIAITRLML
jgi:hypothetical protein